VLQVRNVPDDLHVQSRRRAAVAGMSLSDYVLRELERVADRSPMAEVFARSAAHRVRMPADEIVEPTALIVAVYVALAEVVDATLVTGDRRLSRAPGLRCPVSVIG
jgi:antitoxin FitA